VIDPQTPSTLYAGTSGGVLKSFDGGASWITANSGLPAFSIKTLAIDPQTPSTLYAGTWGESVFKSINGGAFWSTGNNRISENHIHYITDIAIDPQTPSTLYAGTLGGVLKSTNSGASWSGASLGLTYKTIDALVIDPQTPSTLYASTSHDKLTNEGALRGIVGVVFKSVDGGASWSAANTGLPDKNISALVVDPQTPSTLYASTNEYEYTDEGVFQRVVGGAIFKSADGGTSWSAVNTELSAHDILTLAIDPLTPSTLYAGTSEGVFKSVDGGASWNAANAGLNATQIKALVIDPQTPSTLYAGTSKGVFRSNNGGNCWSAVNIGLPATQINRLAIDPQTPSILYAVTWYGGVFKGRLVDWEPSPFFPIILPEVPLGCIQP